MVPLLNPMTTIGELEPSAIIPLGFDMTLYPVIADPPSLIGAVKLTEAEALPAVTVPMVGAPGIVAGVMALDATDADPVPTLLVAVTVKV